MRSSYDNDLKNLQAEILKMGEAVKHAITEALDALYTHDLIKAQAVIDDDAFVDECDKTVEALCLKLLLLQHPVASDMRIVSSSLKMITDLERMGDFAADIAEIVVAGGKTKTGYTIGFLREMGDAVLEMADGALRAYMNADVLLARSVCEADDKVDELFGGAREVLVAQIRKNESFAERALDLMMVSKYLERIGDHATNIAEWVIFAITGVHENTEKGDFKA